MLAILLLILAVVSRIVPHEPNFTPAIAVALFGGAYLSRKMAIVLPLCFLAVSDLILGFHNTMIFTWIATVLISLLGLTLRQHKSVVNTFAASVGAAILFFVITNLGVWFVSGLYPHTWAGFQECFWMAVPFFKNTLVSSVVYTAVLFGAYELCAMRLRKTRFASLV